MFVHIFLFYSNYIHVLFFYYSYNLTIFYSANKPYPSGNTTADNIRKQQYINIYDGLIKEAGRSYGLTGILFHYSFYAFIFMLIEIKIEIEWMN